MTRRTRDLKLIAEDMEKWVYVVAAWLLDCEYILCNTVVPVLP
jgi:hypothetical protein